MSKYSKEFKEEALKLSESQSLILCKPQNLLQNDDII